MANRSLLVCGGRWFNLVDEVHDTLGAVHRRYPIDELHEGGATGADELAKLWALMTNIPVMTHDADWKLYGSRAGSIRNSRMLRHAKPFLGVAFPGGNGTRDMVEKMRAEKVPVLYGRFIDKAETQVKWEMLDGR